MSDRIKKLQDFVDWFKTHIKGYEKGEGQIFFNRLVQAFGNTGILEVGARCEEQVKKRKGTTGFADFVWRPRVVIELKERGVKLEKHYEQAFEYWLTLVPNRPKYMVLCNFDEFWVYDLNTQINDPVHKLKTADLAKDWGALAFLFPKEETPVFNNNNVEVTVEAAKTIGSMFFSMTGRKVDQEIAQRFVLQIVVALFAEDVGLIPKYTLNRILTDAAKNPVFQKEMTDLFVAMSTESKQKKPKKFIDIPYFNGGIFNHVDAIELTFDEIILLAEASKQDWSKVRPSIFGSIFEASMDPNKRHDLGAHFTYEIDIQKIVFPTIVKPIRIKIESAKTKKDYAKILQEIREFKVLDPACGSGNFLYIAFRELRRLEVEVMELIQDKEKTKQISLSMVSPHNFYGIDVNKFGLELAKVAMCIGRKLCADEFKVQDEILPFENLDENFLNDDALFCDWPVADAIIGNPPFLGSRKMRDSGFTEAYLTKIWSLYERDGFSRNADYCCYWFRKAHDHKAQFIGLVGVNSITQNESRKASLDYITFNKGVIHYAISSQEWSGDAAVFVSIVNWVKSSWHEKLVLDGQDVVQINSSLKNESPVTRAKKINSNLKICFQGVVPMPLERYLLDQETATSFFKKDAKNKAVIKRFISADDLTDKFDFKSDRFLIDFDSKTIEEASTFKEPFLFVKEKRRQEKKDDSIHSKWWQLWRPRMDMKIALKNLKKYIAFPGHSKWFIPVIISTEWLPYVNSSFAIASDDYYLLGLLSSKLHRDWIGAQSSTIKADIRYTNTTCFETFPFLWTADDMKKSQVRDIMQELDEYRILTMKERKYGITKLYNEFFNEPNSRIYKLHEKLNIACCELYGWKYKADKNYNEELFNLNMKMHKEEALDKKSSLEKLSKVSKKAMAKKLHKK